MKAERVVAITTKNFDEAEFILRRFPNVKWTIIDEYTTIFNIDLHYETEAYLAVKEWYKVKETEKED